MILGIVRSSIATISAVRDYIIETKLWKMDNSNSSPYPYDTARVSELLKRKRRVRGIKSCFPCRHRKVKCSGDLPCESCVSRGHPELCCVPGETGNSSHVAPIPPGRDESRESHSVTRRPDDEADGDMLRREHNRKYVTYPALHQYRLSLIHYLVSFLELIDFRMKMSLLRTTSIL